MTNNLVELPRVKNSMLLKVMLFSLGCVFAIFAFLFVSHQAWAVGVGGGTGDQPGAGGDGPADGTREVVVGNPYDADNHDFRVGCSNWNGAGSWQVNTNCAVTRADMLNTGGGRGFKCGSSAADVTYGSCSNLNPAGATNVQGGDPQICGPAGGGKSAYAETWHLRFVDQYRSLYEYKGGQRILIGTYLYAHIAYNTFMGCVYPFDSYSYQTCYWAYGGDSWYSPSRAAIANSGTYFQKRPALGSDPWGPPTGGSGTTPPNCARTGSAWVQFDTDVKDLGYYKLQVNWNQKTYTNVKWVTDSGQVLRENWSGGGTSTQYAANYWSYTCRPGAPNATEGPYNSAGAIPNRDAYLNPATCPQTSWQCVLTTPSTAGLDRTAVTNGTVNPKTGVTVMRNGEQVPITFSTVKVIDTSTAADVDLTNGAAGPSARNINKIEYVDKVKAGSTPFNGTDPNAANQYFKFFKAPGSTVTESFGTYYLNANQNLDKAISFYWASDSASQPFAMQRNYRVSGEFLVPHGGTIGAGGAGAPQGMIWKTGTYDCMEYSGRGANRVATGKLLTGETNPITVVRATNQ